MFLLIVKRWVFEVSHYNLPRDQAATGMNVWELISSFQLKTMPLALQKKNFFLYCLDYSLASLFEFGCRLRWSRDGWLAWAPGFLSLNFLMNTIRLTVLHASGRTSWKSAWMKQKTLGWVCWCGTGYRIYSTISWAIFTQIKTEVNENLGSRGGLGL